MAADAVAIPTTSNTTAGKWLRRLLIVRPRSGVILAETQARIALVASPVFTSKVAVIVVKIYAEYKSWAMEKAGSCATSFLQ